MPSPSFNQDTELVQFFTDVEPLRDAFNSSVAAPTLTKRLLVIHGVGGVGKSSLLRMFRLHCKSAKVPVALASGDEAKSALDVLTRWTDNLKADGVAFPSFGKTFEHYRAIQAKVDEQAKKAQDARGRMADIAGKAASKTAEAAGGALLGAAIGAPLGSVRGGMGAEALVDWMRGFLAHPDIDLFLEPARKLTDDFLTDIAKASDKRRIVLMLDTFEQMTALDDWVRDVARRLHANVLFVITGRALPNWSRAWDGWMVIAQVEELKPMTEDVMRDLVRRYYATLRGGQPNPAQVEAIIRFARGLPMVVTSAVQLWVKYGVEDFQSVKTEIVANLVDRLMEGVPKELIPALEAAAIVRWFDQPILRAVTGFADVREVYNELRRFPFVRVRSVGLGLVETVREMVDENIRVQDAGRHRQMHEKAANYYQNRLVRTAGEEAWRIGLEWLYQLVKIGEKAGIVKCQTVADELVHYRRVDRLRELLNDASTYPLEQESSRLWLEYYKSRVSQLEAELSNTENILQNLVDSENVESKPIEVSEDLIEYDVFISHAWEDKESFARPLAEALRRKRLKVWFDEFALRVGDGLRRSIDRGLANSKYGVVVLSPYFFAKEWPQKELDGLVSRETYGQKVILPVWHNITADQVRKYSPTLADRVAVVSDKGIEYVVAELLRAMRTH